MHSSPNVRTTAAVWRAIHSEAKARDIVVRLAHHVGGVRQQGQPARQKSAANFHRQRPCDQRQRDQQASTVGSPAGP